MNSSLHLSIAASTHPAQNSASGVLAFLDSVGSIRTISPIGPAALIFTQGDPANELFHVQEGTVRKSVLSRDGREVVVAVLGPGDFFGEECIAGQPFRIATASALTEGALLAVEKEQMFRMLHRYAQLTDWFLSQTLARLTRIEDDLADLRSNPGEKRLARTLLLLARYGKKDEDRRILPRLSQTMLAEMVGTTRSRVNFFMNRFKRQGLIDYDDDSLTINHALRRIVDEDEAFGPHWAACLVNHDRPHLGRPPVDRQKSLGKAPLDRRDQDECLPPLLTAASASIVQEELVPNDGCGFSLHRPCDLHGPGAQFPHRRQMDQSDDIEVAGCCAEPRRTRARGRPRRHESERLSRRPWPLWLQSRRTVAPRSMLGGDRASNEAYDGPKGFSIA